jgi:hypothetical protein
VDWRGLAAVILAIGVSLALVVTLVSAVVTKHTISDQESALISGVIGAAIGAVATYLGGGGWVHGTDAGEASSSSGDGGGANGGGEGGG